jgi:hypothetical protein
MHTRDRKERGIYERDPGNEVWWIRYADVSGRIRREKAGTKSAAITLYRKRKTEVLQGKKLPELLNRAAVPTLRNFGQRFTEAIQTRCAAKPKTITFYNQQLTRLLEFEPLANARLDAIDESLIQSFVQHRCQQRSRTGSNRKRRVGKPAKEHSAPQP